MQRFSILCIIALSLPLMCHGAGYVCANYAVGGKIDEPSLGIELGGIFLSSLHPTGGALSVGLGVSIADTDEDPPSAEEPPVTEPVYSVLRDYNDGNEQEVTLTFGAEMIPALFAVAGVGYASQDVTTIGTAGDQRYEVDSETDTNISFMVGLRYVIHGLNAGIGYHSRRGVMASLGIAF